MFEAERFPSLRQHLPRKVAGALFQIDLGGRTAAVTGAGRGIGRTVALALAGAGASVAVLARSIPEIEAVADEVAALGVRAVAVPCDVADPGAVSPAFRRIADDLGPVDILCNVAGTNHRAPAASFPLDRWEQVLSVNLRGTLLCSQAVAPGMLRRGWGRILNVTSMLAHQGTPDLAAYASSKGGVAQLTKVLACEWGSGGVTVNAISPGYVRTPLTEPLWHDDTFRKRVVSRTAAGRWGDPEDVAPLVVFLSSDAARWINGAVIPVDGGFLAGDPALRPGGGHG